MQSKNQVRSDFHFNDSASVPLPYLSYCVDFTSRRNTACFLFRNKKLSKNDKNLLTNGNLCDKIQITKNDKCVRKGQYYEKTKLFCNDNLNTCKGGIRAYNRMLYIRTFNCQCL